MRDKKPVPTAKYVGYVLNILGLWIGFNMGFAGPMAVVMVMTWAALGLIVVLPLSIYDIFKKKLVYDGIAGLVLSLTCGLSALLGVVFSVTHVIIKAGN